MSWDYEFDARALKELKKLGRQAQQQIIEYLEYLESRIAGKDEDPRRFGKPLRGDLKGLWRYRIGDHRLIGSIKSDQLIVLVLRVGHRRHIYD